MPMAVGQVPSGASRADGPAIWAAAFLDPAAVADEPVKTAGLHVAGKLVGLANHRLSGPEHKPAVLGHGPGNPLERDLLFFEAQVQKDVAAQDDVEFAGVRSRLEQIVDLQTHVLAERLNRAPAFGRLLEPFDHLADGEAALHFELAVHASASAIDAFVRHVGAEDVDGPAAPLLGLFGKKHGERIDLLTGGAARRPDAQPLRLLAPLHELGKRVPLKHVERSTVAEEIGFVIEQCLDHFLGQARLLSHDEDRDEFIERGNAAFAQETGECGLDPPAAAHRQLLASPRLEQSRENPAGAIAYLHAGCPSMRDAIRRAILSGGRTAQASPASRTARGMPQTAQLAPSSARIEPPQPTSRDAPSTPSRPIPVRTTPTALAP